MGFPLRNTKLVMYSLGLELMEHYDPAKCNLDSRYFYMGIAGGGVLFALILQTVSIILTKRLSVPQFFSIIFVSIFAFLFMYMQTNLISSEIKSSIMIGVQKKSQGLDLVFDNAELLKKKFKNIKLEIIGGGPDEKYFKTRAKNSKLQTKFFGYIPSENKIDAILSKWDIGIATYIPEESNVTHYSDPSKIKYYLNFAIPVITTNVFLFSKEISQYKAGVVVDYFNPQELIEAIENILKKYNFYSKNAYRLAEKYNYKILYKQIFND